MVRNALKEKQQVLAKVRAGMASLDPLHSSPVEEGVRPSRLSVVVACDLSDVDRRLRFHGQHHEVPLCISWAKGQTWLTQFSTALGFASG